MLRLIILLLATWLIQACERHQSIQPSGKVVKIGVLLPEQGQGSRRVQDGLQGINIARRQQPYLNNGDKIQLIVKYTSENPQQVTEIIKTLLLEDQVVALLIFSDSDLMMAISSLADRYKTPFIALTATHPDVTLDRAYVNQIVFDDRFQGTVAALFVRDDLLIDRVAVIHDPDNASSTFLADEFIKKYITVNGKVVDALPWPDQKERVQLMLDKIMEKHPELLYLPMPVAKVLKIAEMLQQYEQHPLMMGADGLLAQALLLNADQIEMMEGLMATDFFSHSISLTSFGHMVNEKYTFGNNKTLMSYAPLGAEGYALLVQAINRCQNLADQRECINNKLRDSLGIEGIMDKVVINFDGKAKRALIVNKIENAEPRFMVKVR